MEGFPCQRFGHIPRRASLLTEHDDPRVVILHREPSVIRVWLIANSRWGRASSVDTSAVGWLGLAEHRPMNAGRRLAHDGTGARAGQERREQGRSRPCRSADVVLLCW